MILDSGTSAPSGADSLPLSRNRSTGLTLHLGVLQQPYRSRGKGVSPMMTGDVAEILESKYGLFSAFYRAHEKSIANGIASSMQGSLEALLSGHVVDTWGAATQNIQKEFRDFISTREAERVGMVGVPTKAALRGVNHRLRHPYRKNNAPRPSFRDTGLLMASMRAWVT